MFERLQTTTCIVLISLSMSCSGASVEPSEPSDPAEPADLADPAVPADPTELATPGAELMGPTTRILLSISYPTSEEPPCSTFRAIVDQRDPIDLGSFCGDIREDLSATGGVLNVQGFDGSELRWAFRAIRTDDILRFQRRNHSAGGDWSDITTMSVPSVGGFLTGINWPSNSWPTPPTE